MDDIQNREDIAHLMNVFYSKMLKDPIVGYIFTDVAKLDLEEHLPSLTDFWENTLFTANRYKKNVMQIHHNLHFQENLTPEHFKQWLFLLTTSVEENFKGEKAVELLMKANNVARIMQVKLHSHK
jgi:hemoglobin